VKLLKLYFLMIFLECFLYKRTDFVPTFNLGLTVTPDRLVFIVILISGLSKFTRGELRFPGFGRLECYMFLFAFVCTVSTFTVGGGRRVWFYLFDFIYNPLVTFLLIKSIPHIADNLKSICTGFLPIGAYLAINGIFEHFGPYALVWPKYILDPHIGIQFERVRGSFASSEALGGALTVTFLFYALYITWVGRRKRSWAYAILVITPVVIYTTNQRSAWVGFSLCLGLLALAKTKMRPLARTLVAVGVLVFLSGVAIHLSFWQSQTLFSTRQGTIDYRRVNNLTTLAMGMANPVFGVGFGNFPIEWPKYFRPIEGANVPDLTDGNHNTFLGLFAEVGLVGLIPYLMIFSFMFRVGIRVFTHGAGFARDFSLVFLLLTVNYLFGANFSDYRSGPFQNTVLFVIFGSVAAMDLQRRHSTAPDLPMRAIR
jgi:O-antigen ligase